MADLGGLARTHSRIEGLTDFRPNERIWWIYVRNAAIELASRHDFPNLQDACDRLKAFPENLPNERECWLAFREEVARVLAEYG